jgi:transcriptional regulator with XRE-family HTH domain
LLLQKKSLGKEFVPTAVAHTFGDAAKSLRAVGPPEGGSARRIDPGKCIRELREERLVKPSDIERTSRAIADAKGNADFYVSHSTLADIEAGSVPSIYKLFSLAVCLGVPLDKLLSPFGIDSEEATSLGVRGPNPLPPLVTPEAGFRFQLNFDTQFAFQETTLLRVPPQDAGVLPTSLPKRLDPKRYRYAVIGSKDETMADLLPAGTLVEIDTTQITVQVFTWRAMRDRPLYLVWHTKGHTCCWCQLDGRELTLLPHPLSPLPVQRFRVPVEATIIGRVTNAWLPFQTPVLRRAAY